MTFQPLDELRNPPVPDPVAQWMDRLERDSLWLTEAGEKIRKWRAEDAAAGNPWEIDQ